MTEQELLSQITKLCDDRNIIYHHCYDSRKCAGNGFPDLVIAGKHRVLWVELKSQYGTFDPQQTKWKYALLATGQHWCTWRPSDLHHGYIAQTLAEL
jgi:hypothetical protein